MRANRAPRAQPAHPVHPAAQMFGADAVPEPRDTIVTRWASDPHSRGSYSYTKAPTLGWAGFHDAHNK